TSSDGRHGPLREKIRRTHRRAYVKRSEDDLAVARSHWLYDALFSTAPDHIDLYEKPLARNVQLWDSDFHLLLDGPRATPEQVRRAARTVEEGGLFGYRFIAPAMRVGQHEIYWHRPLVAYVSRSGRTGTLIDAPTGYLTAHDAEQPGVKAALELWPRLLRRELHVANVDLFLDGLTDEKQETLLNVRKLLEAHE